MDVTLLYFDGCPNWQGTEALLGALSAEYGFSLERTKVESAHEAEALGFRGSPTVLIDGADPFSDPSAPVGLSCRIYRTSGRLVAAPTRAMLTEAIEGAMGS